MGWRCVLEVDKVGRAQLVQLSGSVLRGEADRARAVLWSLAGESSPSIAARLGVRPEQVRRWRSLFRQRGVPALRARPRPGRRPHKREAALAVAREVLATSVADRPVWTLARLAAEITARTGETISSGHLSVVLRKGATAGVGRVTPSRGVRMQGLSTMPGCAWSS